MIMVSMNMTMVKIMKMTKNSIMIWKNMLHLALSSAFMMLRDWTESTFQVFTFILLSTFLVDGKTRIVSIMIFKEILYFIDVLSTDPDPGDID